MLRTIHYGDFWVDMTQACENGLPPASYSRQEAQSDYLNALYFNPWFLVKQPDGLMSELQVSWSLRGALLHNVVVAMNLAPALHKDLSLRQRCELAACGFVCCDLFRMLAALKCKELKPPKGSMFAAPQTIANIQAVALIVMAISCSKPESWTPWKRGNGRLSEISIEQFFGMVRSQSPNSQHTIRSYWQAAARCCLKTGASLTRNLQTDTWCLLYPIVF